MATYQLRLTAQDVSTLRFVASRGYAEAVYRAYTACETFESAPNASGHCPCCDGDGYADCECDVVLDLPEHMAWAIADEEANNGGHGFGPVSAELTEKLYGLLHSIV